MSNRTFIQLEDLQVEVIRRRVKRLRITIYPPDGEIRMVVPLRASSREVEALLNDRLSWIRKHQARFRAMPRPVAPRYADGETFRLWGEALTLRVIKSPADRTRVAHHFSTGEILLELKDPSSIETRVRVLDGWYRAQLRPEIERMVASWEPVLGVRVAEARIRRMRTLWGSCNIRDRRIWLNVELVHLPPKALDYVVLHEMAHLLERYHNARFYGILDRAMPGWREIEGTLKRIPLCG